MNSHRLNEPDRRIVVRIGHKWFETAEHQEDGQGRLSYVLLNKGKGVAQPGEWKPWEQAKRQGLL